MAVIATQRLSKRFGDRAVLRDVEFVVGAGELLGLVGPNGAGKSTLLRTLIGLVRRDSGDVKVLDRDPGTADLSIRADTCYLPGETGVYHGMTGRGFLDFAFGFYPRHQNELRDRLLAEFDLPLHRSIRTYSAGMKQKLAITATLVPDVALYLLDEPDRALDAQVRFFLRDVLRDLKAAGKTIVLSSHHLSEVETLADRLEFLIDGALIPAARLAQARERLRRRPRLRLRDAAVSDLPAGAALVRTEADGTHVVQTDGDPFAYLQTVDPAVIESAEVGVVRLEDLYQELLRADDAPQESSEAGA